MVAVPVLTLCGWVAVVLLLNWFSASPVRELVRSVPGKDGGPPESERAKPGELNIELAGKLETFNGVPSNLPGSWPRFSSGRARQGSR